LTSPFRTDESFDRPKQFLTSEWLFEAWRVDFLKKSYRFRLVGAAGREDEGLAALRKSGLNISIDVNATFPGHHHITQDDVKGGRLFRSKLLKRAETAIGQRHLMSGKVSSKRLADERVVVDDEDPKRWERHP
jgi:hypothetical protein